VASLVPAVQRKTLLPKTWRVVASLSMERAACSSPAAVVRQCVEAEAFQDAVVASVAPPWMHWRPETLAREVLWKSRLSRRILHWSHKTCREKGNGRSR